MSPICKVFVEILGAVRAILFWLAEREAKFLPEDATRTEGGGRISYAKRWAGKTPTGDVLFSFMPPRTEIQTTSGRQGENGPSYLYARVRPELPVEAAKPFAEHAVFLLDTSISEHPDRFDVNMKLLRKVLETDPDVKHFNVLAFNVGATWVEPQGWLDNTPAGRAKALARLDGIFLEGATDLSAALDKVVEPGFDVAKGTPLNLFLLSDGQITWGEKDVAALVARFETRCPFRTRCHCYRTGLGADNLELFEALTRRGGGVFNCFTEIDLPAAAAAQPNSEKHKRTKPTCASARSHPAGVEIPLETNSAASRVAARQPAAKSLAR